ncbi:MAG: TolC family protein [Myxococcales bacterium]|nr:TolC family protein [Myxococcales bacterium]
MENLSKYSLRGIKKIAFILLLTLVLAPMTAFAGASKPEAVKLTAEQAVARALRHNLSLEVERLQAALSDAPERAANAAFAPTLFGDASISSSPGQVSASRAGVAPVSNLSVGGGIGMRKTFSTGTSVDVSLSSTALIATQGTLSSQNGVDKLYQSSAKLSASQSLLNGISKSANEIGITEARMQRDAAKRALARKAEQVSAQVLAAYFDLDAALRKDAAQALAVKTAERAYDDTKKLVAAGKSAPPDLLTVELSLAQQRRQRVTTTQAISDARDKLSRLIGLSAPGALTTPEIITSGETPSLPGAVAIDAMLSSAFERRGDYQAAVEQIDLNKKKLSAAKHKLLPKLDLVGSVFVTGIGADGGDAGAAGSNISQGYASSFEMNRVGWSAGLVFSMPLGNDAAKAQTKLADLALSRATTQAALVKQQIAQELLVARRAVQAAKSQLELRELAAKVAERKLSDHRALYAAGKIAAALLASVQAEAASEALGAAEARAALSKAVVSLHSAAGSLLSGMKLSI